MLDLPVLRPWQVIDVSNGLFCLYDESDRTIMLWNPSIRKSIVLPKPRVLSDLLDEVHVGFGSITTGNEHKVVLFSTHLGTEAEIFELSTGSWRVISLGSNSFLTGNAVAFNQQARLKDILHWSAFSLDFTLSHCICSFDMENESFGALMVPSCLQHDDSVHILPYTFRDSLCLAEFTKCFEKFCNLWVLKEYGVADSWEKLFIINGEQQYIIGLCYFGHNGEILLHRDGRSTGDTELVSYDCNDNQVENVVLLSPGKWVSYEIYTYVESLFFVKGPVAVKIDAES